MWQTGDMRKAVKLLTLVACLALLSGDVPRCDAMIMPYPPGIEKLAKNSDLVAKVQVLSTEGSSIKAGESKKFRLLQNPFWDVQRANLQYISVIKGTAPAAGSYFYYRGNFPVLKRQITFDESEENYAHYDLRQGKCYLLFINKLVLDKPTNDLIQASSNLTLRHWEGFVPCADDTPLPDNASATSAIWSELAKGVQSKDADQQDFSAHMLLELSAGTATCIAGSEDFKRRDVVALLFKDGADSLPLCRTSTKMRSIMRDLADQSPYMRTDTLMRYAFTGVQDAVSSWASWPIRGNLSIKPALPFLLSVARDTNNYDAETRSYAIACLGGLKNDRASAISIDRHLSQWLESKEPDVLSKALLLSSEYPTHQGQWQKFASHRENIVRSSVYCAMGLARRAQDVSVLQNGLKDKDAKAASAAALALMMYPTAQVKSVLTASLKDDVFGEGFAAKLAGIDGDLAKDELLRVCQKQDRTLTGAGMTDKRIAFQNGLGTDTRYLCINALAKYLDSKSSVQLAEMSMQKYLDGLEVIAVKDASQTGKVYELLRTHRLDGRAKAFKKKAMATQPTLPAICFDQVDMCIKSGATKVK